MPVRALKGSLHNKSMEPHSLRRSAMTCSDSALSHARTQPSNWKQILVCGFRRPRERKSGRPVPLHERVADLRARQHSALVAQLGVEARVLVSSSWFGSVAVLFVTAVLVHHRAALCTANLAHLCGRIRASARSVDWHANQPCAGPSKRGS